MDNYSWTCTSQTFYNCHTLSEMNTYPGHRTIDLLQRNNRNNLLFSNRNTVFTIFEKGKIAADLLPSFYKLVTTTSFNQIVLAQPKLLVGMGVWLLNHLLQQTSFELKQAQYFNTLLALDTIIYRNRTSMWKACHHFSCKKTMKAEILNLYEVKDSPWLLILF